MNVKVYSINFIYMSIYVDICFQTQRFKTPAGWGFFNWTLSTERAQLCLFLHHWLKPQAKHAQKAFTFFISPPFLYLSGLEHLMVPGKIVLPWAGSNPSGAGNKCDQSKTKARPQNRWKKWKATRKGLLTCFGKFLLLMEFANWPAVESWQHSLLTRVLIKAGFGKAGHSSLGNGKWEMDPEPLLAWHLTGPDVIFCDRFSRCSLQEGINKTQKTWYLHSKMY